MTEEKKSPHDYPQTEQKHPDEWEQDLNPDRTKGQNIGEHPPEEEPEVTYASEIKEIRNMLGETFSPQELREIPVVTAGGRLQQGKTYLNLRDPARIPFDATADMTAGPNNLFVPKRDTPYSHWNRLRGIDEPERT